jgi:hypothetical protein
MTNIEKYLVKLIADPATTSIICLPRGIKVRTPDDRVGEAVIRYHTNTSERPGEMVLVALPNAKNPVILVTWPWLSIRLTAASAI